MLSVNLKCLYALCLWKVTLVLFVTSAVTADEREGFFNGSAYVKLIQPISLHDHIGLSFKSCIGGELFSQQANGNKISLSAHPDGLYFQAQVFGRHYDVRLPARLLDNTWYTVNIIYKLGNLSIAAGGHQQIIANKTYNVDILHPDLSNKNSVLIVGDRFHGCLLDGPGLQFNSTNIQPFNVIWGPCPLKNAGCIKLDHCFHEPCMGHGMCVSRPDRYECHCTPRYSGNNCEIDNGSPCDRNPCMNGGRCEEDNKGNYWCICDTTHSGQHCENDTPNQTCDPNPCQNNGTCRISPLNPELRECTCLPGFRGQFCEININECLSNPCKNGGTCINGINSYTCLCGRTGYTGENCEININECEPINPCLNQGSCFDTYGGYTCKCQTGFSGQNCELNLNECSSSPCQNGGQCVDKVGSYECICTAGHIGKNCETSIDPCAVVPSPCAPDFDCIKTNDGLYSCVCKPGFQGTPPNCTDMSMFMSCTSNPCQNGGSCLTSGDHFTCNCLPGYKGKLCQTNINECLSDPCQNGGSCIDGVNSFQCICAENWTGDRCHLEITSCYPSPCQNGGSCTIKNQKEYRCECQPGYEGMNCEINTECSGVSCTEEPLCTETDSDGTCVNFKTTKAYLDPCVSGPCNNGTCKSYGDSFTCTCKEGFTGNSCEMDIDECKLMPNVCNSGICYNTAGSYQCFCRPGFAGNQCNIDIDECLSHPCMNNATCENNINHFRCICGAGFTGVTCETDINECESSPCLNDATCVDHIASFSCVCPVGFTGYLCETNIDDCQSQPCLNEGLCIDGINNYQCNCSDTGFIGQHCEHNINDCESSPCVNGGVCIDQVKDYMCECYKGYTGKDCQTDINECESSPCHYNGTCLEYSDRSLYGRPGLPEIFSQEFDYSHAGGYYCVCVPGTTGMNCEIDIKECESSPCIRGTCIEKIGGYTCECEGGFEGEFCDVEINECERFSPCVNGSCIDRRNDYDCICVSGFGGKNCSVELIGCVQNNCANNGVCIPYLENETDHKFNCTCPNGFHGKLCEKITTMSLSGSSYVVVNTSREEGYDIQFRFKTTLPNGLLAIGKGLTFYFLELINGRLNLRSSLLNKWEGVFVGSGLNDSKWQKVFVAINTSHLVLAANEEQTIYPISLIEASNSSHTSFPTTYLGGTISYLRRLSQSPFVGCAEDVVINGEWVIPQAPQPIDLPGPPISLVNVEVGCPREKQCSPNPCFSGGHCTDLWRNFSCSCERPFLGHTCQYNLTAATFGHENTSSSFVRVGVNEIARRAFRAIVDISMFIRTRQDKGLIFYLGSEPGTLPFQEENFIIAELENGELRVRIQFSGNPEAYTVGGVRLYNGHSHLIQVVRNQTLVQVKINGTEYFRKTISTSEHLNIKVLYLGGMPTLPAVADPNGRRVRRQAVEVPTNGLTDSRSKNDLTNGKEDPGFVYFKGIVQDVQVSNGSHTMVVEFFPLQVEDLDIPPSVGNVTFDHNMVLEGEVSDDSCRSNPCHHNGSCYVTWNDFRCECTHGYKGKDCQEMEFCQLQDCPTGSFCRNLDDGYECVANTTLRGRGSDMLTYKLNTSTTDTTFQEVSLSSITIMFRSKVGGTILLVTSPDGKKYFSVSVYKDQITVTWNLNDSPDSPGEVHRFAKDAPDGNWTSIFIKEKNKVLFGGFVDSFDPAFTANDFPTDSWVQLLKTGKINVGGPAAWPEDRFVETVSVSSRHAYTIQDDPGTLENSDAPVFGNSVDFPATLPPIGDSLAGGFYKGCLGEIHIGNLLLPFFVPDELYNENFTAKYYYALEQQVSNQIECILCFDDDCQHEGRCLSPNATYACDCPIGYQEDDCSRDIDWCTFEEGGKCENGGTCVDQIANYTCSCIDGYTGSRCEIDIDECASNPCVNGGTCLDKIGKFECVCAEGFEDTTCDKIKIITCADVPCRNGSACTDGFNKNTLDNFTCLCAEGFVRKLCDTPFCFETECQNNGVCDVREAPRCLCDRGYEGKLCEKEIDECAPNPCQNGGTCKDLLARYVCECNDGWRGVDCEVDIDECLIHRDICGAGSCQNLPGSYKCVCNPVEEQRMCGYNCNISDPCAGNPCENGGTCVEDCISTPPKYTCQCTPGFVGGNCTEPAITSGHSASDIAIIVGPILAFLLIAAGVGLTVFVMMARKKRATRGTYSPSQQEYCNPRVEIDNVIKPPPEERLI